MMVTGAALLAREPDVDERGIREAFAGNLCRCGSHNRIVRAVLAARPGGP
jgi:nicotinate dehydrogenase subunit A